MSGPSCSGVGVVGRPHTRRLMTPATRGWQTATTDMACPRRTAGRGQDARQASQTRGGKAEQHRLYALLKRNRWTEGSVHRRMRKQWHGRRATNQTVLEPGTCTAKGWRGRAWVYMQGMEHGRSIAFRTRVRTDPPVPFASSCSPTDGWKSITLWTKDRCAAPALAVMPPRVWTRATLSPSTESEQSSPVKKCAG